MHLNVSNFEKFIVPLILKSNDKNVSSVVILKFPTSSETYDCLPTVWMEFQGFINEVSYSSWTQRSNIPLVKAIAIHEDPVLFD